MMKRTRVLMMLSYINVLMILNLEECQVYFNICARKIFIIEIEIEIKIFFMICYFLQTLNFRMLTTFTTRTPNTTISSPSKIKQKTELPEQNSPETIAHDVVPVQSQSKTAIEGEQGIWVHGDLKENNPNEIVLI